MDKYTYYDAVCLLMGGFCDKIRRIEWSDETFLIKDIDTIVKVSGKNKIDFIATSEEMNTNDWQII